MCPVRYVMKIRRRFPYFINLIVAPAAVSGICANFVAESPSPHAIPRTADRA